MAVLFLFVFVFMCMLLPFPATALIQVLGLPPTPTSFLSVTLGVVLALTSPDTSPATSLDTPFAQNYSSNNVPVIEVVKVYGKLAGSECYGKQAPKGSSCQINLKDLEERLLSDKTATSATAASFISRQDFEAKLNTMEFSWPLKPFGVDQSPSLVKTAVMNKGAETMVFMQELEARGLYDPRNPTGPLPTSLRPSLNKLLQSEGVIDPRAIDRAYDVLYEVMYSGSGAAVAQGILVGGGGDQGNKFLDYYEFLKLFGPNSVSWPK